MEILNQFYCTLIFNPTSTVSAAFASPAVGIITSDPATCALDSTGTTSCTFTVITTWDATLANSLSLPYQINISATNLARITGNPLTYTQLTPTVYLPQTGQTPTLPIAATAGMDGYTATGIAWAYVSSGSTTPATRFTVGSDAEANCVTDNLTGLMWVKDLNTVTINSVAAGSITTWQNALDSIATANSGAGYCGHTDWYLPTVNDLKSLLNDGQSSPATWLNGQGFANIKTNNYWSSSTYATDTNRAWLVLFSVGYVISATKTDNNYVWPVRGGL